MGPRLTSHLFYSSTDHPGPVRDSGFRLQVVHLLVQEGQRRRSMGQEGNLGLLDATPRLQLSVIHSVDRFSTRFATNLTTALIAFSWSRGRLLFLIQYLRGCTFRRRVSAIRTMLIIARSRDCHDYSLMHLLSVAGTCRTTVSLPARLGVTLCSDGW